MKKISTSILCFLIFFSPFVQGKIWVEKSTKKILKTCEDSGIYEIFIEAAKNEHEGFQIVFKAENEPYKSISVSISDLKGQSDSVIASQNAEFYLEYYVFLDFASPCDNLWAPDCGGYDIYKRGKGYYPDALVPFYDPYGETKKSVAEPFNVDAKDLQTVFVDLFIPKDLPAGVYDGEITVKSAGTIVQKIPVSVQVWDFEIPDKRSVATAYGFSGNQIKYYHGGKNGSDAAKLEMISKNYEFEIHRHRIDFTTYNPGVSFAFDKDNKLIPVDYSGYDAYMEPRIEGTYFPDGGGINRFNAGMFQPGHGTMGMTEDQFSMAAKDFAEHLEKKGWLSHTYLYSLDEPWLPDNIKNGSYQKIKDTVNLLNKYTNLWKGHVLVTGPWLEVLDGFVDILWIYGVL
jgi:hypothetical protein